VIEYSSLGLLKYFELGIPTPNSRTSNYCTRSLPTQSCL